MKTQNNIYILLFLFLIIVIAVTFMHYVVRKNFLIYTTIPCDENEHSCFIYDCSGSLTNECDEAPFKKIAVPAKDVPVCFLEHTCSSSECSTTQGCVQTFCSNENLEEGEVCQG